MRALAATLGALVLVMSIPSEAQQPNVSGRRLSPEDVRSVSPALEKYTQERLYGEVWKRPGLSPRDRSIGRLDAAYNNAGVQNVLAETADAPRDDYDRVMAINLRGVRSCMKFELQQMRKQSSGAIVNCSSLGRLVGGAQRGSYHAAKHGVMGLTKKCGARICSARHSHQCRVPRADLDTDG